MKTTKILIVDDHEVVRDGLRNILTSLDNISIAGEAGNGEDAVKMYSSLKPDLVIMDISMPGMNGIEATRVIKEKDPDARILILTMHDNQEYLNQIIRSGAKGFILKNTDKEELLDAVKTVASGDNFFSKDISKLIIDNYIRTAKETEKNDGYKEVPLTKREIEILKLIASGYSNQEIANILYISYNTVDTHRKNIMHKLSIKNTAGLVRYAIEKGLISLN
ncbi:MAG TPA: response regulator transcription factor [Ignavibacteria bacterium]|jgi:two-component system nitrate/nitrite response regulator NarL|nr:response regulator transcription factor [Ignavibacteria bacterium]HAX47444.1 DNA-binding response regulator [Bacteroidota bacterium]MBN8585932.1 response regulator transcription factor [Ignavibacteria bacterium]NOS84179.1 response regulator transcription factor [Ignavibacteria bacterium]HMQ81037.1 response regulator transcription factor [Ignavibacteria bacterium]